MNAPVTILRKTASQIWNQLLAHQDHHDVRQVRWRALKAVPRKPSTTRDAVTQILQPVKLGQ